MAKSKSSKPDTGKSDLSKAKQNGVTKTAEPVKAAKPEKQSKKSAKAPPPPESEDESEAESESSASNSASGDESDSSASDSASGDESDATSASESKTATLSKSAKVNGAKPATNGTKKSAEGSDASESESESESDGSDSDSESDAEDKPAAVNGAKSAAKSDKDASDSSDSSSSDGSDDEDAEMTEPTAAVKRKAEADAEPTAKKQKTGGSSGPKSLFVGNISWNVDEEWLAREFGAYGEVTGARIITDKESGRSKGYGYVDFVNGEEAEEAVKKMHEYELDGRQLRVDMAESRADRPAQTPRDKFDSRAKSFGDTVSAPTETLWCGNLSFDVTAETLRENFEEYGSITRISLPTHPDSGQLKGFGYVAFSTVEEATAAFEAWKGQPLMGRPIRLDYSQPRANNGDSRGGRGGGRDFGGRGGGGFGGRGGGGRGRGGDRGGRWTRGGGGAGRGRGMSTNRGGVGDFSGSKVTF